MDQLKDTKSSQRNSTVATPTLTSPASLLPHQKGPSAMALREDGVLQTHVPAPAKGRPRDIQILHANHLPGCGPPQGRLAEDLGSPLGKASCPWTESSEGPSSLSPASLVRANLQLQAQKPASAPGSSSSSHVPGATARVWA